MRDSTPRLLTLIIAFVAIGCSATGDTQEEPPGLVRATDTPAFDATRSRESVMQDLESRDARFGDLFAAVAKGDANALLDLVEWESHSCASRNVYCPGAAPGAVLPTLNVGSAVYFYATRDALLPLFASLFAGEGPPLTLVSQLKESPGEFYLAFESSKSKGEVGAPIQYDGAPLHGIFLHFDSREPFPVDYISFAPVPSFPSERIARDLGLDKLSILFLDNTARIVAEPGTPLPNSPTP